MADESGRNSPFEIATTALAIGAGAAILYRGGGSSLLSDGFKQTSRFLTGVNKDISGHALKDFDASRIRDLYNTHLSGPTSTWKAIGQDIVDNPTQKVRLDSSKSLLNTFTEIFQIKNNPALFKSKFRNEGIIKNLQEQFSAANIGQGNSALEDQIRRFVSHSVDDFKRAVPFRNGEQSFFDEEFVGEHLDRTKFGQQQIDFMKDAILKAKKEAPEVNTNTFEKFQKQLEDLLQDTASLGKKFGSLGNETKTQKVLNRFLGDRPATIDELLASDRAGRLENTKTLSINQGEDDSVDFAVNDVMQLLQNRRDELAKRSAKEAEDFGNLYVDNAVRFKNDNVYSTVDAANVVHKLADEFANTLPGKLAKARDILYIKNQNLWSYFGKGKADPILASSEGFDKSIIQNRYMRVLDKMYKVNDDFQMQYMPELDNTYTTSGKHGTIPRMIKYISGDLDRGKGTGIKLLNDLDILTSPLRPKWQETASIYTKFKDPNWGRNLVNSFLNTSRDDFAGHIDLFDAGSPIGDEYIQNYFRRITKLNKIMGETTVMPSRSTVKKLYDTATGGAKDVLEMYGMEDSALIERLGVLSNRPNVSVYHNYDLINMARSLASNTRSSKQLIKIVSDKAPIASSTITLKHREMLNREILKEAFLQSAHGNSMKLSNINQWLERAGVKGLERNNSKDVANWAVLQSTSTVFSRSTNHSMEILRDSIMNTQSLFSAKAAGGHYADASFADEFRKDMARVAKERFYTFQKGFQVADDLANQDIVQGNNFGEEMLMRKMVGPGEALKSILSLNDFTKAKAFGKQFYAGRKNMQDVTTATMFPYFSIMRLVEPLSAVGLNFSAKSTGSVGSLAKNVALKRILPIAAGMTAYSYLDYRSEAYTGTSISGALANNLAAIDLGFRRVQDSVGIGGLRDRGRDINPMTQYMFGKDYQTYDERKEWYESGYSPVRKGRWWSFGSSSEFRGGKISHYEPNFLVRAHSDWHNIGVYGSSDEKWAHSLIPTPSHPLSTLRYLADPYWLEKKHQWDRPYPVTGKMFEENTPWGAVLNPTIGELIKPVRRMHENELQGTLVDVRNLISNANDAIRGKEQSQGLIRLKGGIGGAAEPVSFTAALAPNSTDRVMNIHISDGQVKTTYLGEGGASAYPALSLTDFEPIHDAIQANAMGAAEGMPGQGGIGSQVGSAAQAKLTFEDQVAIQSKAGSFFANIIRNYIPKHNVRDYISSVNAGTKLRAQTKPPGGIITPDSIYTTQARVGMDLLMNGESLADVRNISTTDEFLKEASYSTRELGGIYGFLSDEINKPEKRNKLQGAGRMESFSRQFWDSSVGGVGGEFMEIARRFFPHEDHSINQINPLKNTMPEWIPSRFREGDPYQQIPKGEMRLPGAGYESMYKLHPDMYGNYGSFDRFKILADIAPWSKEYKQWRSLAAQATQDPELKKQMKEIKKRVQLQSKVHEFYPYHFKNLDTDSRRVVVNEILTDNKFNVIGDENVYRMAGISVKRGKMDPGLEGFLKPGMEVRIQTDTDTKTGSNPDRSVNAVVFTETGNLNKEMLDKDVATIREDGSAASTYARFSQSQIDRGRVYEALAHLPVPFLHDKFMRVNSPLESYKQEQVYGVPYSSWSHPISTMLVPAFQKGFAYGPAVQLAGLGTAVLANKVKASGAKGGAVLAADLLWAATNRGAFVGGLTGFITTIGGKHIKKGMYIGTAIQIAGYLSTRSDKPIDNTLNFAVVGGLLAKQLNLPKIGINIGVGKGVLIGAAAGLALTAIRNPSFNMEKMFGVYIPERVERKREMAEYFDRLKYIKYMGLYEKASRDAKRHEGVDIKRIINKYERDSKEREKIKRELLESQQMISNSYPEGDSEREELLIKINERLKAIQYPVQILKAGNYARTALAYKQAAESTIYGLSENASFAQLMRAVDKNDRDYILEFAKERNPGRQKEILKYISPYERKVLQTAWGQKQDAVEDNTSYFSRHKLPGFFWAGWKPENNLDNIEIKTIKNEGMLLSDFGFYDSQSQTSDTQRARPIEDYNKGTGPIEIRKNLLTALSGAGLIGVDVNIQPSSESGIQMITNIVRITDYKIKEGMNSVFGRTFYE